MSLINLIISQLLDFTNIKITFEISFLVLRFCHYVRNIVMNVNHYRYCSISVELRRWSGDGALFTRLDKYRVFFHISNC